MRLAEKFDASGKIILNPGKEPVPEWISNVNGNLIIYTKALEMGIIIGRMNM